MFLKIRLKKGWDQLFIYLSYSRIIAVAIRATRTISKKEMHHVDWEAVHYLLLVFAFIINISNFCRVKKCSRSITLDTSS